MISLICRAILFAFNLVQGMPRVSQNFYLDSRVVDGARQLAAQSRVSVGEIYERVMFQHRQNVGLIASDSVPLMPHRGGGRKSRDVLK